MLFNVEAPAGKLGLHFADAPGKQSALVYEVNQTSPIVRSIEVGDVITDISKDDSGWWQGRCNGKQGVFPSNYVKEL